MNPLFLRPHASIIACCTIPFSFCSFDSPSTISVLCAFFCFFFPPDTRILSLFVRPLTGGSGPEPVSRRGGSWETCPCEWRRKLRCLRVLQGERWGGGAHRVLHCRRTNELSLPIERCLLRFAESSYVPNRSIVVGRMMQADAHLVTTFITSNLYVLQMLGLKEGK